MKQRTYIAIDLKSFYASVECRERGLDPLDTNLVVADESRTDKTICLAVTPSLKSYGISGRGRLFEVKQRVKEANAGRQHDAPGHRLDGTSHFFSELQANPSLAIDFIVAPPRMAYYMEYSTRIYQVYLKYPCFISLYYSIEPSLRPLYRSSAARPALRCFICWQKPPCSFHQNPVDCIMVIRCRLPPQLVGTHNLFGQAGEEALKQLDTDGGMLLQQSLQPPSGDAQQLSELCRRSAEAEHAVGKAIFS